MKIRVERITDPDLFRRVAKVTTGRDVKMPWAKALASGHSIIRASQYLLEMEDIPLFVASQLVRSHVGVQWYQRSKRTDRGGEDFAEACRDVRFEADDILNRVSNGDYDGIEDDLIQISDTIDIFKYRFDRYAPTDLTGILNAEAIINISHKRLCSMASKETRQVWGKVVEEIACTDPDLAKHCVPQCLYRGGICPEPKGCGYNRRQAFQEKLEAYKSLFK